MDVSVSEPCDVIRVGGELMSITERATIAPLLSVFMKSRITRQTHACLLCQFCLPFEGSKSDNSFPILEYHIKEH